MLDLPDHQPSAPAAGQAAYDATINQRADQFMAAIDEVRATSFRDETPVPRYGTAPPVEQPGRPSMTPQATGASVMMIAGGFLSLCLGTAVSAVLHFSHGANETVVITLCAAPPAAFLSLGALVKKIKRVLPDEHHHHYNAPVDQRTVHTSTRGVWAKTTNRQ